VLEANLALVSVNQNEVVKKISAIAGIIAVPTFIASVYGMNFDNIPELHWHYGYAIALALMVVTVVALAGFFRRIDWI
jgi:magnesium transporter